MEALLAFNSNDFLEKILTPTLVMAGEEDILTPLSNAKSVENQLPNARLSVIANKAHNFVSEDPSSFINHLLEFFDDSKSNE